MKRITSWTAGLVATATPALAVAHPGHGVHDPGSLAHVFLDFPHSLWLVVAVIGIVACLRMRGASESRGRARSDRRELGDEPDRPAE